MGPARHERVRVSPRLHATNPAGREARESCPAALEARAAAPWWGWRPGLGVDVGRGLEVLVDLETHNVVGFRRRRGWSLGRCSWRGRLRRSECGRWAQVGSRGARSRWVAGSCSGGRA